MSSSFWDSIYLIYTIPECFSFILPIDLLFVWKSSQFGWLASLLCSFPLGHYSYRIYLFTVLLVVLSVLRNLFLLMCFLFSTYLLLIIIEKNKFLVLLVYDNYCFYFIKHGINHLNHRTSYIVCQICYFVSYGNCFYNCCFANV